MPTGAFIVSERPDQAGDIQFQRRDETVAPDDQQDVVEFVQRTLTVLQALFPDREGRFRIYFGQLLSFAQHGLVGEAAAPTNALALIQNLRNEVLLQEGGTVKNRYMGKLAVWAVGSAVLSILIAVLLFPSDSPQPTSPIRAGDGGGTAEAARPDSAKGVGGFFFVWAGSQLGVWLSFGARKRVITFDELPAVEEDRLEPPIRLAFAGLLSIAIALSLTTGFVTISFGTFNPANLKTNAEIALLLGGLLGISEQVLAGKVASQASRLLQGLGRSNAR